MKLISLTPMLRTGNIKESIDFYVNILGFSCQNYSGDLGWASVSKDAINIMLATPNAHESFDRPGFTGSLYLQTDNIDELWNSIKDKATLCYPIENFDYGMREFAVYDNNGYLLQFGQELSGEV